MIRGTWSTYALWAARTLAGFACAVLLAFGGDVTGRVFNLMIGFPWSQAVHINIHLVAIGLGAGFGGYLGWMNLSSRRYRELLILAIVLTAGVIGVYMGRAWGPGVDPSYWWSRYAVDSTIHLSAAVAGTVVATTIGLTYQIILARRDNAREHLSAMTRIDPRSPNLQ